MTQNVNFVLTNWTYAEYDRFVKLFSEQKFQEAGYLAEKLVVDWTAFEDVPAKAEHPIDHLSFDDAIAVITAITYKIKEYTKSIDVEKELEVDTKKWKWNDFTVFQNKATSGDLEGACNMMLQVVRFKAKGATPKKFEDINAVQGVLMFEALMKAVGRNFSGGN